MDTVTGKDGNIITKEKIDRALAEAVSEIAEDVPGGFAEAVDSLSEHFNISAENSALRESAVICVVQRNLLWALGHVLYELFNIECTEDKPGTGTEGSHRE